MSKVLSPGVAAVLALSDELDRFDAVCLPALQSPELPEGMRTEGNRIAACDSKLWCAVWAEEGRIRLWPDSDSLWVKGLALLVKESVEACSAQEIADHPPKIAALLHERGIIDEKRRRGLEEIQRRATACAGAYAAQAQGGEADG